MGRETIYFNVPLLSAILKGYGEITVWYVVGWRESKYLNLASINFTMYVVISLTHVRSTIYTAVRSSAQETTFRVSLGLYGTH